MAHRHKVQHKNVGGAAVAYGNPKVIEEAKSTKTPVKAIAKKDGGKVVGRASGGRLDKRARGGRMSKSPFSSAHHVKK